MRPSVGSWYLVCGLTDEWSQQDLDRRADLDDGQSGSAKRERARNVNSGVAAVLLYRCKAELDTTHDHAAMIGRSRHAQFVRSCTAQSQFWAGRDAEFAEEDNNVRGGK